MIWTDEPYGAGSVKIYITKYSNMFMTIQNIVTGKRINIMRWFMKNIKKKKKELLKEKIESDDIED